MNENKLNTCQTCIYCESCDSTGGQCRYNPPTLAKHLILKGDKDGVVDFIQRMNASLFPVVMVDDIACSKYQENSRMKELCSE